MLPASVTKQKPAWSFLYLSHNNLRPKPTTRSEGKPHFGNQLKVKQVRTYDMFSNQAGLAWCPFGVQGGKALRAQQERWTLMQSTDIKMGKIPFHLVKLTKLTVACYVQTRHSLNSIWSQLTKKIQPLSRPFLTYCNLNSKSRLLKLALKYRTQSDHSLPRKYNLDQDLF